MGMSKHGGHLLQDVAKKNGRKKCLQERGWSTLLAATERSEESDPLATQNFGESYGNY